MKTQTEIFRLGVQVRATSFALQRCLRHGHLEKVYEHGLLIDFGSRKLEVRKYVLSEAI